MSSGPRRRDRIMTVSLLGTLGLLSVGLGRVAQLEIAPAADLEQHLGRRTRTSLDLAFRGSIVDRRGRTLAQSVIGHDLAVDVKVLCDQAVRMADDPNVDPRPALAGALASLTSLDEMDILEVLMADRNARYARLAAAEDIEFMDVDAIRRLRIERIGNDWRIAPRTGSVSGKDPSQRVGAIVLTERPVRHHLTDSPAASIVGAVRAVEWGPSDDELDLLASDVVVDVEGIRTWLESQRDGTIIDPVPLRRQLAAGIAAALGVEAVEIERRLARSSGEPVRLAAAEHLDPDRIRRVRSITVSLDGELRTPPRRHLVEVVDAESLEHLQRRYPEQRGASGIEAMRDETLRPRHGAMTRVVAAGGQTLFVEEGRFEAGQDGASVSLTIDLEIQRLVRDRLQKAIDEHLAVGGWAVVLDPQTGEILAAVDIFDESEAERRGGWPRGYRDPARVKLGPEFARNRIWTDCFDPGSTFKTFFWAWATDLGRAQPGEIIDVPGGGMAGGVKFFGKRPIRDVYGYGGNPNRPSTWELCLEKSINTGMATVARRVTDEEMMAMFDRFGFTHRTGINMGYEGTLAQPPVEKWVPNYTKLSASFGQAVSITPLQLARAYCAIARNDGRLPVLTLSAMALRPFDTPSSPTVAPGTILKTREILKRQFEKVRKDYFGDEGIPYTAFGKSATAQWSRFETDPRTGEDRNVGYHEDRYLSSYVGGAPFDDPRIVVALGLQDPLRGEGANAYAGSAGGAPRGHLGSYAAGRPVHDLLGAILTYLGVPADRLPDPEPTH
jgi:cell division protein FtsI/penicillin-binding protein 2